MEFGILLFSISEGGLTSTLIASRFFTPEGNDPRRKEREQAIVQRAIEDSRHLQVCSESLDKIYSRHLSTAPSTTGPLSGTHPNPSTSSIIVDEIGDMIGTLSASDR